MASSAVQRRDDDLRIRIAREVEAQAANLSRFQAHATLAKQADRLEVQEIRVSPGDIDVRECRFSGLVDVYVMFRFDDGRAFDTAMGFVGSFRGHVDDSQHIVVEEISVDTSGIFE